ncbi:uncharacterized protein [Centruroides vittatus]|uniref:uncharacterized protein n=1 Tax=Centruroides vittatus TaxID=120091 RepID=UPI00350ED8EC
MTKIELELFNDLDMYLFIESGMRGGVSLAGKRFAQANNPLIPETYDKNQPHNYILSIDANNLYGFVMSAYLPVNNFRWLHKDEIDALDITNISDENSIGYILEVDLKYPEYIHDRHDNLPLAVEHTAIPYGENVHLLYTDTDSLTLQIYTKDIYEDFKSFPDIFDFSNYPKTHKLYNEMNKNKLGYFKDETLSKPIIEFCSLKPKMYSYIFDKQNKKTAKGIKKSVIKTFNHDKYKEVLFNTELLRHQQYGIKSKNHVVTTYLQNKISLSPFYDKKFIQDNGIDVVSFGHYSFYS